MPIHGLLFGGIVAHPDLHCLALVEACFQHFCMRGLHQVLVGRSAAVWDIHTEHSWLCHLLFHITAGLCFARKCCWCAALVACACLAGLHPRCFLLPPCRYVGLFSGSCLAVWQFCSSAELTESLLVLCATRCWLSYIHVAAAVVGLILHDGTCYVYQIISFIFVCVGAESCVLVA